MADACLYFGNTPPNLFSRRRRSTTAHHTAGKFSADSDHIWPSLTQAKMNTVFGLAHLANQTAIH